MMKLHLARLFAVVGIFVFTTMSLASAGPAPDMLVKLTTDEIKTFLLNILNIQVFSNSRNLCCKPVQL